MLRLIRKPEPVVVPGAGGATRAPLPPCDACSTDADATRCLHVVGPDLVVLLCRDAAACARRYRGGASPESYAAGLRGEILGVTP
jgi:hypothetical protein